jgi:carboxyl-terminal processing protease
MQSAKKGSAAKITIQKYYLPSGESTQIYGVKSDIVLPSVNEFLPIGESDLDNALEWDSIAPVNHRRTENEFVYDIDNVEEIQKRSFERQKIAPEFKYIHQNIEIFKERKNKKDAILDLAVRLKEKIQDTNSTDQLNELYDSFDELSFPRKELKLKIVEDQLAKSRIARGANDLESNSSIEKEYSKPDSLDIRLHESLRIMSDWLSIREKSQISGTPLSDTKEI